MIKYLILRVPDDYKAEVVATGELFQKIMQLEIPGIDILGIISEDKIKTQIENDLLGTLIDIIENRQQKAPLA